MKKIIKYLNDTIKKQKHLVTFNIVVFILGVIIGSLFLNFITSSDKKILIDQVTLYFDNIKNLTNEVFGIKAYLPTLINNLVWLFIIFILGISMVGIPIVILILFFKGFMLGTTISTIILKYKFKGIIGILLYIFPVYIINIIIYVIMGFYAVYVSIKFLKAFFKKDTLNFKNFLGKYLLTFCISTILLSILSLIDVFLTPLLLKLYTFL